MTTGEQLAHLEGAGLVRRVAVEPDALIGAGPDLEYLFRHALVQDAAYDSLLRSDRRRLHLAVAETLQAGHPDNPELAAVLAAHFAAADEPARALPFYREAAEQAVARYANAEAARHYAHAIALARQLHLGAAELGPLYGGHGQALEWMGTAEAALATYREQETVAQALGDPAMEAAALLAQAVLHATPTSVLDAAQAQALIDRAAPLIQAAGDTPAEVRRLWLQMLIYRWGPGLATALAAGEAALALARAHDLAEQIAFTLNDLYHCYLALGRYDDAAAASVEVLMRWRALGNLTMLADALASRAGFYIRTSAYATALALGDEALAISRGTGNLWGQANARYIRGLCLYHQGRFTAARAEAEQCFDLAARSGFTLREVNSSYLQILIYCALGLPARADALLQQFTHLAAKMPGSQDSVLALRLRVCAVAADWDGVAALAASPEVMALLPESATLTFTLHTTCGERALAEGRPAQDHADRAVAVMRQEQPTTSLADALELQGRARAAAGDLAGARIALDEARELTAPTGTRRILWRIYGTLAAVAAAAGDAAQAAEYHAAARAEVDYIVDQLDDPALRGAFLARPAVRAVWEEPSAR